MSEGETWESFLERVLARLHDLKRRGVMADVFIHLGRVDKQTGERKPPRLSHHEF